VLLLDFLCMMTHANVADARSHRSNAVVMSKTYSGVIISSHLHCIGYARPTACRSECRYQVITPGDLLYRSFVE